MAQHSIPRHERSKIEHSRGFTLIELLVVVAIIGILAAVAVGQYQRSIVKAKEAVLKEDLFVMRTQINMYFADKGRYPADLNALVDDKYLRTLPVDPITESADTWVLEYAPWEMLEAGQPAGVWNVRSGADGEGLNGTPYKEW